MKTTLAILILLFITITMSSCNEAQGHKPRVLEQRSLPEMLCLDGIIYYYWGNGIAVKYRVNELGEVEVDTCARYNKTIINNIGTGRE